MAETQTREELEDMDEAQLKALAASRGITVTASDGTGEPSVDDYVEALAPPDSPVGADSIEEEDEAVVEGNKKAYRAQQRAAQPTTRIDETVPGGRYVNRQGKTVNARGQEVDEEGKPLKDDEKEYPDSPE
jgi:hypothetical protein